MAKMNFDEEGLLEDNRIVEVGRADLVGEYIGKTATKVQSVFQKAKGKLLFIDEAYSLADSYKGSYGDEAINTIIQEMENRRQDTIVIFAGYPNEMEQFFSRNPGFKSRVPFKIEFDDYSANELTEIVKLQANKMGFEIQPKALEKVKKICTESKKRSDFGNGRFCRNLFENAMLSYALRVFGEKSNNAENNFILTCEDFPPLKNDDSTRKTAVKIGFSF